MNKILLLSLIGGSVLLSGCAREKTEYTVESWEPISNEATLYCVQEGHQIERITDNGSRSVICILSEQEQYDIWDYYNMSHKDKPTDE